MDGNCVLVPASYYSIKEKYPEDSPCKHCVYHKYGCPNQPTFVLNGYKYIAIEQDAKELPKNEIWCKKCKSNSGKIFHKTLWNARPAFAIKCKYCGSEYMMYEDRIRAQYTGFTNGFGDFVHADPHLSGSPKITPNVKRHTSNPFLDEIRAEIEYQNTRNEIMEKVFGKHQEEENAEVVYSSASGETPTAMQIAMQKAMSKIS